MRVNIHDFLVLLLRICRTAALVTGLLFATLACADEIDSRPLSLRLGVELPYGVLADPSGELSVDAVTAMPAERFTKRPGGFAAGFTTSTFWLRVELPARVKNDKEWWLVLGPPFLDTLRIVEPSQDGWRIHEGGDLLPLATRELNYRDFVFRLRPQGDQPLFIRVKSSSAVLLYGALWQPAAFATQALPDARNWGLYFGMAALNTIFIAGLAVVFRQRKFFALVSSSLLSYPLVAGLQGFHIWLLWPESPQWASMSVGVLVCLTSAAAIWLLRDCLSLKQNFPHLDKIYLGIAGLLALCALSVPLGLYYWVAGSVTLITELATLGALFMSVRLAVLGNRVQIAFAIAFLIHFLSVAPALAINYGLIPPSRALHTLWQYELIPHMLIIAGIFLFEIRRSHLQWVSSRNEALLATREAKDMLANLVDERTRDLSCAQNALQVALDGERSALFEQKQFMAMVSHEFRTPLAVIDATAVNLTDVPPQDQCDLDLRAGQLLRATRRLSKLTDTCLADARLRDDAFALQRSDVVLESLIREAADIVSWSVKHTLLVDCSAAPVHWNCDPALIRIALSNLLDNAVKYGGPGQVSVIATLEAENLLISIKDEGEGIPASDQLRVFERYQRGIHSPEGKGSGLGLSVVKMISEAHFGSIDMVAHPKSGCVFELRLPPVSASLL